MTFAMTDGLGLIQFVVHKTIVTTETTNLDKATKFLQNISHDGIKTINR